MLDPDRVRLFVRAALDEDLGRGDLTTEVTVPDRARACGDLVAKQELVVAGMEVARMVFQVLDPALQWAPEAREGERFFPGTVMGT
ncbi:MAG: nicotinate-nucleotide diphosphorylase (carboxylating), partial [Acidobacteria bacterium]